MNLMKSSILEELKNFIDRKTGIINSLLKNPFWNDEPKFYHYTAVICNTTYFTNVINFDQTGGGISLDENEAKIKALAEGIERYCNALYNKKNFIFSSFKKIKSKAINPLKFKSFSDLQISEFGEDFIFNETTKFYWVKGYDILNRCEIFIPSQLVYVPYSFLSEPIIRLPITTGSALDINYKNVILKGICEVLERDAFMIYWLNKINPIEIRVDNFKEFRKIKIYLDEYLLDWKVFLLKIDLKVPVILSVIIDKSNYGPKISVGLDSNLDILSSIKKSLFEAIGGRLFAKICRLKNIKVGKYDEIDSHKKRSLYWAKNKSIKHLDFILNTPKRMSINEIRKIMRPVKNQKDLINSIKKVKYNILAVNMTSPDVLKLSSFKIVKILIPELVPLYLNEHYKYLGSERIYTVPEKLGYSPLCEKELNKIPHPFL